MENRFFNQTMLDILLNPWKWQIVSSLFPSDLEPVKNLEYQQRAENTSHRHPTQELLIALEGEGLFSLGGKTYHYTPGTVFFFGAFETHADRFFPLTPEIIHLLISILRRRFLVCLQSVTNTKFVNAARMEFPLVETEQGVLLNQYWSGLRGSGVLPAPLVRTGFILAAGLLASAIAERGFVMQEKKDSDSPQKRIIDVIQEHIHERAGNAASLENLAHLAGYSKYHLLRLFKKQMGQTIHQYINFCRMARASEMEKEGYTHKQISATLGFSSQSTFARWLRRQEQGNTAR